jgi:integrase
MLPEETEDEIVFFGGKDYIALFCESTRYVKMNGQCFTIRHSRQHAGEIGHHHTVSAWGKEAGLELEDVKTLLRHANIATTSDIYGDLGLEAKRRIQQRLINFVKEQVPATI